MRALLWKIDINCPITPFVRYRRTKQTNKQTKTPNKHTYKTKQNKTKTPNKQTHKTKTPNKQTNKRSHV